MMMWLIDVIVPGVGGVGGVTGGVTAGGVVVGGGFPVVCVGALELAPHADIITTNKIAKVNWTTKKARARFDTTRPFRFLRVGSSSSLWGWQLCKLLHRHPGSSIPDPRRRMQRDPEPHTGVFWIYAASPGATFFIRAETERSAAPARRSRQACVSFQPCFPSCSRRRSWARSQ